MLANRVCSAHSCSRLWVVFSPLSFSQGIKRTPFPSCQWILRDTCIREYNQTRKLLTWLAQTMASKHGRFTGTWWTRTRVWSWKDGNVWQAHCPEPRNYIPNSVYADYITASWRRTHSFWSRVAAPSAKIPLIISSVAWGMFRGAKGTNCRE